MCGGFNGQESLDTMEMYDAQTDQWTLLERMSTHRSGVGMIGFNSNLYAIGGFNGNHRLKTGKLKKQSDNGVFLPKMID